MVVVGCAEVDTTADVEGDTAAVVDEADAASDVVVGTDEPPVVPGGVTNVRFGSGSGELHATSATSATPIIARGHGCLRPALRIAPTPSTRHGDDITKAYAACSGALVHAATVQFPKDQVDHLRRDIGKRYKVVASPRQGKLTAELQDMDHPCGRTRFADE